MSVDAVVASSNHFKWPIAINKESKQAHKKLIKENVGMTDRWKKYGDKIGMEHVQEQPHV